MNKLSDILMDSPQPPRQTAGDETSSPAGFALLSPVGGVFKRLSKRASKQAETIAPLDDGRGAFLERTGHAKLLDTHGKENLNVPL